MYVPVLTHSCRLMQILHTTKLRQHTASLVQRVLIRLLQEQLQRLLVMTVLKEVFQSDLHSITMEIRSQPLQLIQMVVFNWVQLPLVL